MNENVSKTSRFIPIVNHRHHIEAESCHDENNLLDDDEEDFFNEKSNKIVHVSFGLIFRNIYGRNVLGGVKVNFFFIQDRYHFKKTL